VILVPRIAVRIHFLYLAFEALVGLQAYTFPPTFTFLTRVEALRRFTISDHSMWTELPLVLQAPVGVLVHAIFAVAFASLPACGLPACSSFPTAGFLEALGAVLAVSELAFLCFYCNSFPAFL